MKFTKAFEAENGYNPRIVINRLNKKPRIRIYKKSGEYEYYDISKGLTAFNDRSISLQYIWCLAFGVKM